MYLSQLEYRGALKKTIGRKSRETVPLITAAIQTPFY
jgi:hypothetical protein